MLLFHLNMLIKIMQELLFLIEVEYLIDMLIIKRAVKFLVLGLTHLHSTCFLS
jgi:hypothetical protein